MYVNVEFLNGEPIENVITCMNYKMDKTIFFGYKDEILKQKNSTERFLKKYCGVEEVVFEELSQKKLQKVVERMRNTIKEEYDAGNQVFFDITGGENLILVALGILSKEFETPMHMYNVEKDLLIELEEGATASISESAPQQKIEMNLSSFIELRGGVINYHLHKSIKNLDDEEFDADVEALWQISQKYGQAWNVFSGFLKEYCLTDNLCVEISTKTIRKSLKEAKNQKLNSVEMLNSMLLDCASVGILCQLECGSERYRFKYKNETIKQYLWDAGSILELYVYKQKHKNYTDCQVGIHLDWDGVIHPMTGEDVLNEIDVLALSGNVPTFISCKNGNVTPIALYELETVARKFGGKYAKKVLAAPNGVSDVNMKRAEEMGIEVWQKL